MAGLRQLSSAALATGLAKLCRYPAALLARGAIANLSVGVFAGRELLLPAIGFLADVLDIAHRDVAAFEKPVVAVVAAQEFDLRVQVVLSNSLSVALEQFRPYRLPGLPVEAVFGRHPGIGIIRCHGAV